MFFNCPHFDFLFNCKHFGKCLLWLYTHVYLYVHVKCMSIMWVTGPNVGEEIPTHTSNSWAPPECPIICLSYDTIYSEMAWDSTSKGLSSIGLFPKPYFRFQSQAQVVNWASDQWPPPAREANHRSRLLTVLINWL